MANPDKSFDAAFESAKQEFRAKLKNESLYTQLLQTTSIDQVYDVTDKLQEEQSRTGRLRNLSKIEPFLQGLKGYASVIEVFMQAKSDVLALIWGPIKLLLLWADVLKQSMDAIIETTAQIGALLPEFRKMNQLFGHNEVIKEVLILFFKDMLEFYVIALRFFSSPRLKLLFEALWPRQKEKIQVVVTHIERHTLLLRNEVRLEHIQAEYDFRQRALEHFEKAEASHQRQEYESLRTSVAPRTYQDLLQHLEDGACHEAGNWLLEHPLFCSWIDGSDTSPSVLWLQGIPGSGKTYLAKTVVHKAQKQGHSLCAFLTYKFSKTTSVLSILHSLIFQLATDDTDLQSIVCHSSGKEFRNNVDHAAKIFRILLCSSGPVYITVDGLDEMESVVRCRIVKILLQLSSDIKELHLLVSCRPEADLIDVLKDSTSRIQINDLNVDGIQAYIGQRKLALYHERAFFPQARIEIDALLAPLAKKSEGMFLYAKIVLDSIWYLEFDEMRQDLGILPKTLDEAYERVLAKINKLSSPVAREKARNIIGWIGVSPTPLTIYELEQALVVHAEGTSGSGRVSSKLPLVRLCGPIVEVVDEYVQFVHFTVYDSSINEAIDPQMSRVSLAGCCVKYLCQYHHDPDIDSDTKYRLMLDGAFRFHDYAVLNWLNLIGNVLSQRAPKVLPNELLELLKCLLDRRANSTHVRSGDLESEDWKQFKHNDPSLYALLNASTKFQNLRSTLSIKGRKDRDWTKLDPLTISSTTCDIHERLEKLLSTTNFTREDVYQALHRHFGARLFKCTYVGCHMRRYGFESRALCNSHTKDHALVWECTFLGCEFNEGGFLSRKMRDDHLKQFHVNERLATHDLSKEHDKDVLYRYSCELVKADNASGIEALLSAGKLMDATQVGDLLACAAEHASARLLRTLMTLINEKKFVIGKHQMFFLDYAHLLVRSVAGNNHETFGFLLSLEKKEWHNISNLDLGFRGDSYLKVLKLPLVENKMLDMVCTAFEQQFSHFTYHPLGGKVNVPVHHEVALIRLWELIPKYQWEQSPYRKLLSVVASSAACSTRLTKYLLDKGLSVDGVLQKFGPTALHRALRQNTREGAELARFLLLNGADPEITQQYGNVKKQIKDEKGAQHMSKWLGITWDELVEQTRRKRQELASSDLTPENVVNEVDGKPDEYLVAITSS